MTSGNQLPIDGAFGPLTDQAVRAFQRDRGLVVDGIAGQQTGASLGIWETPRAQSAARPQSRPQPAVALPSQNQSNCHPSYSPCVPNSDRDLDCRDVGFSVVVSGWDEYGLDGNDNDGFGCESY